MSIESKIKKAILNNRLNLNKIGEIPKQKEEILKKYLK